MVRGIIRRETFIIPLTMIPLPTFPPVRGQPEPADLQHESGAERAALIWTVKDLSGEQSAFIWVLLGFRPCTLRSVFIILPSMIPELLT